MRNNHCSVLMLVVLNRSVKALYRIVVLLDNHFHVSMNKRSVKKTFYL